MFSFFGNSKSPRATSCFWNQILSTKDRNLIDESFSPLGDIDAKSIFDSNDPFQIINTIDYLKKEIAKLEITQTLWPKGLTEKQQALNATINELLQLQAEMNRH